MSETLLQLQGLTKAYPGVIANQDVAFDIGKSEIHALLGENGAGKSTLLKIISKITTPTAGEIKIKGSTASLLEVGTGFHPELTGVENIYLSGAVLGMKKKQIKENMVCLVPAIQYIGNRVTISACRIFCKKFCISSSSVIFSFISFNSLLLIFALTMSSSQNPSTICTK